MNLDVSNIIEFTNRMYLLDRNNYDDIMSFIDELTAFIRANYKELGVTNELLLKKFDLLMGELYNIMLDYKKYMEEKQNDKGYSFIDSLLFMSFAVVFMLILIISYAG